MAVSRLYSHQVSESAEALTVLPQTLVEQMLALLQQTQLPDTAALQAVC